jgi:hypothetical protein
MDNDEGRAALGFQPGVKKYFGFLESEYGYECVESGLYSVVYQTRLLEIDIRHEEPSYELDFCIERRDDPGYHKPGRIIYAILSLFSLVAPEIPFSDQSARTAAQVDEWLRTNSDIIRNRCQSILRGDKAMFEAMRKMWSR